MTNEQGAESGGAIDREELAQLIGDWRKSAKKLEFYGAEGGARAVDACADELEEVVFDGFE